VFLASAFYWVRVDDDPEGAVGSETTQIVSNTYAGGPMRLCLELPNGAVQRLNSKGSFRVPAGARPVMEAPGSGLGGIPAQVPKVRRLAAGGRRIRTFGPSTNGETVSTRSVRAFGNGCQNRGLLC
jgi:hypothetical protein